MSTRMPTYVYFIQVGTGGPIKIGFSQDPTQRLASIQHHHPTELRLLAIMSGGLAEELELHRRFAPHRLRGEWFAPAHELVAFVLSLPVLEPPTRKEVLAAQAAVMKKLREEPPRLDLLALIRSIAEGARQ